MSKRKAPPIDYAPPRQGRPAVPALPIAFAAVTALVAVIYAGGSWPLLLLGLFTDGLLAILWLCAMTGVGLFFLRLCRVELPGSPALHRAAAAGVGIGLVSLLVLALGLMGIMHAVSAWIILIVGISVFALAVQRRLKLARAEAGKDSAWTWLLLILAPILGIALVAAFVPPGILWGDEPHGYDVVSYHFQIPREWHEAGHIMPLEHNVFSFFPFNVEMHYLLAMHLRGGAWAGMYLAQLMHCLLYTSPSPRDRG